MIALRFVSACLVTAALFAMCAVLAPQTIAMVKNYSGRELGPGILPAVCLLGIAGCMVYVFFVELRLFLKSRDAVAKKETEPEPSPFGLPLRDFIMRSTAGIALLWLYVIIWSLTSFLPATFLFCFALAFLTQGATGWTGKKLAQACISLVLFTVSAWWVFEQLLMVPLR